MENFVDHSENHSVATPSSRWIEMSKGEISELAHLFVRENVNASFKQFPSFNERFRRPLSKPTFLTYAHETGVAKGFVCVITIGLLGAKCGVVIDGPVMLDGGICPANVAQTLAAWLRSRGYAFVRFTHPDRAMLNSFAGMSEAVAENPLPFVPRYGGELVVQLKADDSEMLAGFQRIARRDIKNARAAGCVVESSSDVNEFRRLWPIFVRQSKEKGFRYRRLENYEAMFALGPQKNLFRLYTAYYDEQRPVFTLLVLRDHAEAWAMIAAFDKDACGDKPTPCCLAYWTAMGEFRDLGCVRFNLGQPTGSVYGFKRKFRPAIKTAPFMVTLVFRPLRYQICIRLLVPCVIGIFRVMNNLRAGGKTKSHFDVNKAAAQMEPDMIAFAHREDLSA